MYRYYSTNGRRPVSAADWTQPEMYVFNFEQSCVSLLRAPNQLSIDSCISGYARRYATRVGGLEELGVGTHHVHLAEDLSPSD